MDGTFSAPTTENEKYGKYTYEKVSRVSPMSKESPNFSKSPGVYETPVRERRLSRISENDVCLPCTRPPARGEPLSNIPIYTTPPSRLRDFKIENPFDVTLRKKLHLPFISPTLFTKTTSPSEDDEQFSWSIEDLANLFPADIDEFQAQNDQLCDEETEEQVQSSISRFFESNIIVPSPWGAIDSCRQIPKLDLDTTPIKSVKIPESFTDKLVEVEEEEEVEEANEKEKAGDGEEEKCPSIFTIKVKREVWTQTELTFPEDSLLLLLDSLSEKIIPDSLEPSENFMQLELAPPIRSEPICSSPCFNPYKNILSSTIHTPKGKILTRSFGTPLGSSSLMSPIGLSPIVHTFQQVTVNLEVSRDSMESFCCSCHKLCDISIDSGFASTSSQTDMALPSILPKSIEEVLKPFQTFLQEQSEIEEAGEEISLNTSLSRRRKLLFHELSDMSVSSINSFENSDDSS